MLNELGTKSEAGVSKPIHPLAAARRLCKQSGWTLSNLQLQKILYLAQMFHLGKKSTRLVDGDFEAWAYGPVLPQVYSQTKIFGGGPVREVFGAAPIFDEERAAMLDEAALELGKLSAGRLVSITHWKEGAWAKYYQPDVRGIKIPDQAIIDEYNAHAREQQRRKSS
ncbi:MAG: DUF4065 domain-containing protein [Alphaproteobacteria bacterium]|nr:DUF4065 domain-containing protein [Alphaproteobacteria bacterium]